MIGPGRYLCGCDPVAKKLEFKGSRTDAEGYDICPEHGQRLYGYRSTLKRSSWNGNLEISKADPSEVKRDNRDPILVYAMTMAAEEPEDNDNIASTNGHTGLT